MKKIFFIVFWLALFVLVPATVFRTTPFALAIKHPATLMNSLQRLVGLTLYILLFVQIILGAFMPKWTEKIGNWIFPFHIFECRLIYSLALLHPILYVLYNHFVNSGFDFYAAFINACILCKYQSSYFTSLGIASFWLLTVTVFAAVFRNSTNWLKKNWRKLHIINYVIFLLVSAHGFLLGTDFRVQPFYSFAILSFAIIAGVVIFVELPRLFTNFRNWIRS